MSSAMRRRRGGRYRYFMVKVMMGKKAMTTDYQERLRDEHVHQRDGRDKREHTAVQLSA